MCVSGVAHTRWQAAASQIDVCIAGCVIYARQANKRGVVVHSLFGKQSAERALQAPPASKVTGPFADALNSSVHRLKTLSETELKQLLELLFSCQRWTNFPLRTPGQPASCKSGAAGTRSVALPLTSRCCASGMCFICHAIMTVL